MMGSDLDVTIALRVFEWQLLDSVGDPYRHPYPFWVNGKPTKPQPWPTSWDAMREVVEVMQARGYSWRFSSVCDSAGRISWRAEVVQKPWVAWLVDAMEDADTLPHAVCLAALKAVEA